MIAPTGTIGLVMDCDTTGIEPDFALVKFKKLAGGGYFKIINQSVPAALEKLGYGSAQIEEIVAYAVGHGTIGNAPGINHTSLDGHGFGPNELAKVDAALASALTSALCSTSGHWAKSSAPKCLASRRKAERSDIRSAALPGLFQSGHRCGQRPRLRHHDARRGTAPQRRALRDLRLRQPLWQKGKRYSVGQQPHLHDGRSAIVHLRRDLQDDQHAE